MVDSNQYTRNANNYVHVEPIPPRNRRTLATLELRVDLGESAQPESRDRLGELMTLIFNFINNMEDSGISTIDYDLVVDFFSKEIENLVSFNPSNIDYKVYASNIFDGVPCD